MATQQTTASQWVILEALTSRFPAFNPIRNEMSLWISSNSEFIEFDCESNTIKSKFQFPYGFNPKFHSLSGPYESDDGDLMVIVDGYSAKLLIFNTTIKEYSIAIPMPQLGWDTASLMIRGNIHIIHGQDNGLRDSTSQYVIYSMETSKGMVFNDDSNCPKLQCVAFTKSEDDSIFYKFGGYSTHHLSDSFYVGTLQDDDASKPIIWEKAPHFTLKRPLVDFGYIQYQQYIIIFGGETTGDSTGNKVLDEIYVLDTRSNCGWIQCSIQCPLKSAYVAVLDHKDRVHLFTKYTPNGVHDKRHYCIAVKDLIVDSEKMKSEKGNVQRVSTMKVNELEPIQEHQDDDERKESDKETEIKNLRKLVLKLNEMKVQNQNKVERLEKTNANLTRMLRESGSKTVKLETLAFDMKMKQRNDNMAMEKMKKEIWELRSEIERLKSADSKSCD